MPQGSPARASSWDKVEITYRNHKGEHFSVRGPLNVARPPQGHPVLLQAGSSECESAWNKDPVFGVLGINRDPGDGGSTVASMGDMGAGWGMLVVETIAKHKIATDVRQVP